MWNYKNENQVSEAKQQFFKLAGIPENPYQEKVTTYVLGPITIKLPSTTQVALHDLHHVATGYETNWQGEFEVAAWELGSRASFKPGALFFILEGFFFGSLINPKTTFNAFIRGRRSQNLFQCSPTDLLLFENRSVGFLRESLNIPAIDTKLKPTLTDILAYSTLLIFELAAHGLVVLGAAQLF